MDTVKEPDEVPRAPLLQLVERASRTMVGELVRRLNEAGFGDQTLAQSRVFGAIPPGGIRLTDLADRLHMTKQAVGELVDQIEAANFVERVPDPSDARAKLIRFTDKGWRAVDAALAAFVKMEAGLAEATSAEAVEHAREVLAATETVFGDDPDGG